jgi:hypothetical protein
MLIPSNSEAFSNTIKFIKENEIYHDEELFRYILETICRVTYSLGSNEQLLNNVQKIKLLINLAINIIKNEEFQTNSLLMDYSFIITDNKSILESIEGKIMFETIIQYLATTLKFNTTNTMIFTSVLQTFVFVSTHNEVSDIILSSGCLDIFFSQHLKINDDYIMCRLLLLLEMNILKISNKAIIDYFIERKYIDVLPSLISKFSTNVELFKIMCICVKNLSMCGEKYAIECCRNKKLLDNNGHHP